MYLMILHVQHAIVSAFALYPSFGVADVWMHTARWDYRATLARCVAPDTACAPN